MSGGLDSDTWSSVLESCVPDTYEAVTMRPTYEWGAERNVRLPLYTGATREEPIHGMFSFAPCLPAAASQSGFSRPSVRLDRFVNPGLMMGLKAHHNVPYDQVKDLWRQVVAQEGARACPRHQIRASLSTRCVTRKGRSRPQATWKTGFVDRPRNDASSCRLPLPWSPSATRAWPASQRLVSTPAGSSSRSRAS